MAYAEFFLPLVASWGVYRLWVRGDRLRGRDDPRARHRPL